MEHDVTCRLALPSDARVLAELRWDFQAEDAPDLAATAGREAFLAACEAWMRERLASGAWVAWVADAGGDVVSHVWVAPVEMTPKPGKVVDGWGYVTNVYTRPEWRDRGIGAALMARVQAWALEADLELLLLWPSERSAPFYRRAGFAQEAEAVTFQVRPYAG